MPFEHLKEGLTGIEGVLHVLRTRSERAEQAQEETSRAVTDSLHRQHRDIQAGLKHLHAVVLGAVIGLAMLSVGLTGVVLWTMPAAPTTPNYTPAFVAVDTVLSQEWAKLPKAVQEQLSTAYRAGGVQPPGVRK